MRQSNAEPFANALSAGIATLGLDGSSRMAADLLAYLDELERWNRSYNLTAIRDRGEMVSRHLLDSLCIVHWLHGARVLDVGSGAGLPGIPLALAAPGRHFDLLDANGKKARFLRHVIRTLGIENAAVIERRIADYRPRHCYDTVVARAFGGVAALAAAAAHLTAADGRLLAMRGRASEPVPDCPGWRHLGTHRLTVPGLNAQRHLSVLARNSPNTGRAPGGSSELNR